MIQVTLLGGLLDRHRGEAVGQGARLCRGRREINKAIVETFRGRNIVIPFPQREVRILSGAG